MFTNEVLCTSAVVDNNKICDGGEDGNNNNEIV